jgi:hypothetical protein
MHYSPSAAVSKLPFLAQWTLRLLLCVIATVGSFGSLARADDLTLRDVDVDLVDGVYSLDARLDLRLLDEARRAVEAGLTLRLNYEIVVDRVRRYMPDAEIAALVQRYEISYHALSQRWLVRNLNTGEQFDFGSLEMAIGRISEIRNLPILDAALLTPGSVYQGRVRAVLDLSTAPAAFGWLLFWADDWSDESDWKSWTLRP